MNTRKAELRSIALDIITGRESTKYAADQQAHLLLGIAEVLERRAGTSKSANNLFPRDPELDYEDKLLALEIFWDLILDRIITPGSDHLNPLPFFRLHSEAEERLSK